MSLPEVIESFRTGLMCGCSAAAGSGGGTNAPPSEPSVSVAFDKSVVFYEDAYTNAPNDVVAKRSTRTNLMGSVPVGFLKLR